jgi:pimeloyl-ACP methyl ester carboxylesterase
MTELGKQETDRFIEIGGIRLHYNDVGAGPVLLVTHGGGPGASAWGGLRDAVPALAARCRILLLDLPNFGESQKYVKNPGAHPDVFLSEMVSEFLDALDIFQPVSYYSSSGGAPAALRFALDFPERTHRLIIQAYAPGMARDPDSPGARATTAFMEEPTRESMAKLFELFVPDPRRRTEEAIIARWEAAAAPGHLESRTEFATLTKNTDLSDELPGLGAEVLLIWGAADRIVPVERALHALRAIPRSRACIWGGLTGHLVPHEHPEEFAKVVADFITAASAP